MFAILNLYCNILLWISNQTIVWKCKPRFLLDGIPFSQIKLLLWTVKECTSDATPSKNIPSHVVIMYQVIWLVERYLRAHSLRNLIIVYCFKLWNSKFPALHCRNKMPRARWTLPQTTWPVLPINSLQSSKNNLPRTYLGQNDNKWLFILKFFVT